MTPLSMFRTALALAGICLSVLWIAGQSVRAEDLRNERVRPKAQATLEQRAKAARRAVSELSLTRRQARQLLPIVEQAAALHVERYEEEAELLPEMIEAFDDFARQDALNEGFSPEVERRTIQVNHRFKEDRERITGQLIVLEEQAATVLTRAQRKLVGADEQSRHRSVGRRWRRQDRLAAARQELHEVREQIHPQLGTLGRYLLHPAAGEALAEIAGTRPSQTIHQALSILSRGTENYPRRQFDLQQAEVKELRETINNWNLINGLHLSRRQIEQIVGVYENAKSKRRTIGHKGRRASGQAQTMLITLERSVEEILNPGQRQVLAEYKPCLIPPKNLKDPVRIGQATDNSHLSRWLARARRASDDRLYMLVDRFLEKEAAHLGKPDPAERRRREALLLDTARQAAGMSDVDFELNKAELAERIAPRDRMDELKAEIASLSRAQGRPGLVARFMLKPRFIEQLRERGRQLAEGIEYRPTDLANGPQADRYEPGCATGTSR